MATRQRSKAQNPAPAGPDDKTEENQTKRQKIMVKKIGRLHVLTDEVLQTRLSHLELAELAIAGGADTIQLRQKIGSTRELIEAARQIQAVCTKAGVTFIVNDRVDVAIAAGANGVHLGRDDFPISLARKLLGENAIIGGSAGTIEEAQKCLLEGADYVGFGPVYETTSKDDAGPAAGLELLKQIAQTIPLPIVAIGGITKDNMTNVIKAGAHGIAVISAVCCQEDPREATRCLCSLFRMEQNG
jgi:thiamine-phosphate pyrophosphorylase